MARLLGSSEEEDDLLAWIEDAQPVARLCEISLTTRRGEDAQSEQSRRSEAREASSPDDSAVSQQIACGAALQTHVIRPSQLTYGELPLRQLRTALAKVVDLGHEHSGMDQQDDCSAVEFFDLGCGGGKLVLAAALLLEPLGLDLTAVGIELVGSLVTEAEVLRDELVAKLSSQLSDVHVTDAAERAENIGRLVTAVAATRFVCGDVLDDAANVCASADWVSASAGKPATTTIVLVNGLCFPSIIKAAICERLLCSSSSSSSSSSTTTTTSSTSSTSTSTSSTTPADDSREQGNVFVLSTTPLPWPSARRRVASEPYGAQAYPRQFDLVYTNEDDEEMDFIGMALGGVDLNDDDESEHEQRQEDSKSQPAGAEFAEYGDAANSKIGDKCPKNGGSDGGGRGEGGIGSRFWDDFCLYLYRAV